MYDLIVIGSGPGGEVGAIRAAQLGMKVALVEKSEHLGGTCLNWGCIPTKALLESAKTYDKIKHMEELGFSSKSEITFDWSRIMSRKEGIVDAQRKGLKFLMKKNKIDTFHGLGKLTAPGSVSVTDSAGKITQLKTKNILLATGSRVRELPFAKATGKNLMNSDHVLSITSVPKTLAVIGGGVVGTEFASLFARFGTQVTIIEAGPTILPSEDEEVVKEMMRLLKKQNIQLEMNAKVEKIDEKSSEVSVTLAGQPAKSFEKVLVSIGREPVTQDIGLETLKIKTDKNFVIVDEHYRTSAPNIYAIGDIIPTPALAHTASAEAIHAVEFMADHHPPVINYDANPNAIYTYPEVASIGKTEAKLKAAGTAYKVAKFPFAPMAKAKIENATDGFVKILFEPKYKEILGVHIIGAKATEMIAEFCLGKVLETTLDEIGYTIHPHPTISETIMEAAHAGMGGAIHL